MMSSSGYRRCSGFYYKERELVEFDCGLFHCWGHFSSEGVDGNLVADTVAIVELLDGKVIFVIPDKLKFEDRRDPKEWINPPVESIETTITEETTTVVEGDCITVEEIRQLIMTDENIPQEEREILKDIDEKDLAYLITKTISASLVNSAKIKQEEEDGTKERRLLQQIKNSLTTGKAYCPECNGSLLVRDGQVKCQTCLKEYGDIDAIMMH